jgi:hypothetical protein
MSVERTDTPRVRESAGMRVRDNVTRIRELMGEHASKDDVLAMMNLLRIGSQVQDLWTDLRLMWSRMDDKPREPKES